MKLVFGLGNPGSEYRATRHNLGRDAVAGAALSAAGPGAKFSSKYHSSALEALVGNERVLFLLPETYMNLSGRSVLAAVQGKHAGPNDILVVQDELDLPVGALRFSFGGSAAGHNGIRSIGEALGGAPYARLRLGIGRPETPEPIESFVLRRFAPHERELIEKTTAEAGRAILDWIGEGLDNARQHWNGKKA